MKTLGMMLFAALFIYGCAAKVPTTNTPANTGTTADAPAKEKPAAKKEEAYSPVGVWEYTVDTPDGASSGILRITGGPGTYEASLETDQFGTLEIEGLDIVGTSMTGTINVGGNDAEIECDFDGDDFSGAVVVADDVFPLEGTRKSKG